MNITIILLIVLILFCFFSVEGYIDINNIYNSNEVDSKQPDSVQFYACRQDVFNSNPDYPFQKYPNSNYRVKNNIVKAPQKGTFSAFLDSHKIRTYDHFYHSPICEDDNESYDFNTNIGSQFRLIPGAFPEENIQEIYKDEIEKDNHDLKNPHYKFYNPKNLQNKILYNDEINDLFLKVKLEQPKHHEDNRHLIHDHQYDGTHD